MRRTYYLAGPRHVQIRRQAKYFWWALEDRCRPLLSRLGCSCRGIVRFLGRDPQLVVGVLTTAVLVVLALA